MIRALYKLTRDILSKSIFLLVLFATLSSCNNSKREADKKHYEAISEFSAAIKLDPDNPFNFYNRGVVYHNLEEYLSAISDYTSAIKLDTDFTSAYNNRGIAKENSGLSYCNDFKKACNLEHRKACYLYNKRCN
tara:strand:+ start:510 stop:911 length:402 start_codon:yes stop_codon:yes gene_type:complete